jgi:HD-GYP domain-containing protein (c-di-GMP phosphodiesterase class II)
MRSEFDFFEIEMNHLKGKKTFPFQIFIFNPIHKKYSLVLNGNRPLTKEIEQFINFLLERGGKLAILKKQKKTFLVAQETEEAEIPSLKSRELHSLEKERIMYQKLHEIYLEKNGQLAFQSEFEIACNTDNFEKLIERARVEILTFSVTQSYTVSLAIDFAKKFLIKDNFLNRVVSSAYFTAKTLNINDEEALGDVIVSSFLLHLGYTQLPLSMVRKAQNNLFDEERKLFKKHTILANHLIKRGSLEISERCKSIIFDHHERFNGSGFPGEKYGESIEQLSLLVGAIFHIFEFSSGKITGSKLAMKSVIISIKNKSFTPGLELEFGDKINECISNLINTEKIEDKNIKQVKAA